MARDKPASSRSGRANAVVVATALVVVLLSLGMVLIISSGARRVAESSQQLDWVNQASAAAAAVRAANNQALIFAIDTALGVASSEARDIAIAEARSNATALAATIDTVPTDLSGRPLADRLRAILSSAQDVLARIESGDLTGADEQHSTTFAATYEATKQELTSEQNRLAGEVQAADNLAGRAESITQLLVTLLIPIGAILAYRAVARRQQRESRLTLEARIEAEQRLSAAKDEFIAGMSHELRTPLTSIYGFSEHLIEQGILDPDEALELISLINHDSAELSRMVEDLLAAARLDADKIQLESVPITLIDQFRAVAAPLQRAGNDITVDGSTTRAMGDPGAVRQIARNLIANAVRHGGPEIVVSITERNGVAVCTVADNGPGVDADIAERLFERFVHDGRAVFLSGSVGLGLAIARSLAIAMGGDVAYERQRGWTNFQFRINACESAEPEQLPEPEVVPAEVPRLIVTPPAAKSSASEELIRFDAHG
jgi:signal transduction histidine kinase